MPTENTGYPFDIKSFLSNDLPGYAEDPAKLIAKAKKAKLEAERSNPNYVIGTHPEEDVEELKRDARQAVQRRALVEWDPARFSPGFRATAIAHLAADLTNTPSDVDEFTPEQLAAMTPVAIKIAKEMGAAIKEKRPMVIDGGDPELQAPYWKRVKETTAGKGISALDTTFSGSMVPGRPAQKVASKYLLARERFQGKPKGPWDSGVGSVRELLGQYVGGLGSLAGVATMGVPGFLGRMAVPAAIKGIAGKSALTLGTEALGRTAAGKAVSAGVGNIAAKVGNIPAPGMVKNWLRDSHTEIPETIGAMFSGGFGKPKGAVEAMAQQAIDERTIQGQIDPVVLDLQKRFTPAQREVADRAIESGAIGRHGEIGFKATPATATSKRVIAPLLKIKRLMKKAGLPESELSAVTEAAANIQKLQTEMMAAKLNSLGGSTEELAMKARLLQRQGRYGSKRILRYQTPGLPHGTTPLPAGVDVSEALGPNPSSIGITEKIRSTLMKRKGKGTRPLLPANVRLFKGTSDDARLIAALRAYRTMAGDASVASKVPTELFTRMTPNDPLKYGEMAGKFSAPQTANQVRAMTERMNVGSPLTRRFMGVFKKANVPWSPPTVFKNLVTNKGQENIAMSLPEMLYRDIPAARLVMGGSPKAVELRRLGLLDRTSNMGELAEESAKHGTPAEMEAWLSRGGANTEDLPSRLYQFLEQHSKAKTYLSSEAAGKSMPEAIAEAKRVHFDYGDLTPFLKAVRAHPLSPAPFLTFPLKGTKLLAQTASSKPYQLRKWMLPSEAVTQYNVDRGLLDRREMEDIKKTRAELQRQQGNRVGALLEEFLPRTITGSRNDEGGMRVLDSADPLQYNPLGALSFFTPRGMPNQIPLVNMLKVAAGGQPGRGIYSRIIPGVTPEVAPDVARLEEEVASSQGLAERLRARATLLGAIANGPLGGALRGPLTLAASPLPTNIIRTLLAEHVKAGATEEERSRRRAWQVRYTPSDVPSMWSSSTRPTGNELAKTGAIGLQRPDTLEKLKMRAALNSVKIPKQRVDTMLDFLFRGATPPIPVAPTDPSGM